MTIPTAAMLALGTPNGVADFTGLGDGERRLGMHLDRRRKAPVGRETEQCCDDIYDPSTETVGSSWATFLRVLSAAARSSQHRLQRRQPERCDSGEPGCRQASTYINQYWVTYERWRIRRTYTNNLNYGTPTGLANWYSTSRLDYNQNAKNQIALIVAFGRQASTGPNSPAGSGRRSTRRSRITQ